MLELTKRASDLASQTRIEPQLILQIEGIDLLLGAVPVTVSLKYGSEGAKYGGTGLVYGGVIESPNSRDWIDIEGGGGGSTTKQITQQLLQEQGGTSSVSNLQVKLINKDNALSDVFVPGVNIPDILGARAKVWLAFQGSAFPEDAIKIFDAIIGDSSYGAGFINLTVSSAEELKRQDIFTKLDTELTAAIDDVVTTIPVITTSGFIETADAITSYIRVEDELMEVITVNPTSFIVTRGAQGTNAIAHDDETEAGSFYVYLARPLEGALKLMISGGDEFYKTLNPNSIGLVDNEPVANSIFFESSDLNRDYGIVSGDLVSVSGAANAENNFTDRTIIEVFTTESKRSYIVVDGAPLVTEGDGSACNFKSKYNVLNDGLAMNPVNVDIKEHERLIDVYSTSFPEYQVYMKDTVEAKKFIDKEMYYSGNCFSIPRKGRASVGFTSPPLNIANTPKIDETNILNIDKIRIKRSVQKSFYNSIVHRYTQQLLDDKFLSTQITASADSVARIKNIKNRPLNIESTGLRNTPETLVIIDRMQNRLIERYKFGAKSIKGIKVLYSVGFNLEVGDIVAFGGPDTKIIDPDTGQFIDTKLMEITNKSLAYIGGSVTIDLLDTGFQIDARFGTVSGSSLIDSTATTTAIPLKRSFTTSIARDETFKWVDFVGSKIRVVDEDFTFNEETTIVEISATLPDTLIVSPALSVAPSEDYIVEIALLDDSSADAMLTAKNTHCFLNPTVDVASGASDLIFDVTDASDLLEGQTIKVHNDDFSNDSDDVLIDDITGTTITVSKSLGFTPAIGDFVELIGFLDGTEPYRIV